MSTDSSTGTQSIEVAKVVLRASDGSEHAVERALIVAASATLANVLSDVEDTGAPLELPNIDGATLERVLAFLHRPTAAAAATTTATTATTTTTTTTTTAAASGLGTLVPAPNAAAAAAAEWEHAFVSTDNATIFQLITAASFLEIEALLTLTCNAIGRQIIGKTTAEIRALFNIADDLTPEEVAQITKENEWCVETA